MNRVILKGRFTADPEIRTSADGQTTVGRFSLAVNRRGEGADFIRCLAFNKTAEFIEKYFSKGSETCLEGRIQTGSYKNKDGLTIYTTEVVVDNIEFCGSKSKDEPKDDEFTDIPLEELPWE